MKTEANKLYRKVEIKSKSDLPESDIDMFIHTRDCDKGDNGLRIGYLSSEDFLWYLSGSGDLIHDINWYLLPEPESSLEELRDELAKVIYWNTQRFLKGMGVTEDMPNFKFTMDNSYKIVDEYLKSKQP